MFKPVENRLAFLMAEKLRRQHETLAVYEPLPQQLAFHKSQAPERIIRGGNRGAKTTAAMMEVGWALTGRHPYINYPKEGTCYLVARDGKTLSEVYYKKLLHRGAIRMIKDRLTKKWRTWRPWEKEDAERFERGECRMSPPILPHRFIVGGTKGIAWENKKEHIPSAFTTTTGWEVRFYPSGGAPQVGSDVDLIVFDEEIEHHEWYIECAARLVDRNGRFIWGATPQAGTEQLLDLSERAAKQAGKKNPQVEEFFVTMKDNPYLTESQKITLMQKYENDPEAYRVRILGEFAASGYKVFPEFARPTHCIMREEQDKLFPHGIPRDWTRYMAVDPGHQICAALFVAVPPPGDHPCGDYIYIYDELYIPQCTADKFAKAVRLKALEQSFEAFIIDEHFGRQTSVISGKTVKDQYSACLKEQGIRSRATGYGFIPGCDDIKGRVSMARNNFLIRRDGTTRWRILYEHCPMLIYEIDHYRKKRQKTKGGTIILDEPQQKHCDLMDCLTYLASYEPQYVMAAKRPRMKSAAVVYYAAKQARNKKKGYVNLGPSR